MDQIHESSPVKCCGTYTRVYSFSFKCFTTLQITYRLDCTQCYIFSEQSIVVENLVLWQYLMVE